MIIVAFKVSCHCGVEKSFVKDKKWHIETFSKNALKHTNRHTHFAAET